MSEVRDTSIEAYVEEVESGRLATKRAKIFNIIKRKFDMTPFTPKQLAKECDRFGFKETWKIVSDLKKLGALEELPKATCPISGRKVYWVKMTGAIPSDEPIVRTPRGLNKSIDYILNYMREEHLMVITREGLRDLKD
jgi:hypothetical protein